MTHPPQPILEAKPRPLCKAANMQRLWELSGRPSIVKVRISPMHPTTRPDNYSSPAFNEWEDDQ